MRDEPAPNVIAYLHQRKETKLKTNIFQKIDEICIMQIDGKVQSKQTMGLKRSILLTFRLKTPKTLFNRCTFPIRFYPRRIESCLVASFLRFDRFSAESRRRRR